MYELSHGGPKEAHIGDLSFLWLEITAKCNLECGHCYAESNPRQELFGQLTSDDWFQVIREAAEMKCRQIQFIGGEPTLHPELSRFVAFASSLGFTFIEVFTNSTHLSDALLQSFVDYNVHVATSFYSDDPIVHENITKRPNIFYRTVDGIKRCLNSGLPLRVGIIEMDENVGHSDRARTYLEELGVSNIGIDRERAVGRGSDGLRPSEPFEALCGECWKGKLCVTSSGKAYPCVFSRFAELGQVKMGVDKIVESATLQRFRKSLRDFRNEASSAICPPDFCNPTDSSCGPEFKCMPGQSCNPDTRCLPDDRCAPDIRG
jgi:MoaA/NifB/PqqE/SkfB family radical SAM enzyme